MLDNFATIQTQLQVLFKGNLYKFAEQLIQWDSFEMFPMNSTEKLFVAKTEENEIKIEQFTLE